MLQQDISRMLMINPVKAFPCRLVFSMNMPMFVITSIIKPALGSGFTLRIQATPAFLKCFLKSPLAINAPIAPPIIGEIKSRSSIGNVM